MATDDDYMAFLDKANKDPSEGHAKAQGGGSGGFKAADEGAPVPQALAAAARGKFYTSDADEPFVPVSLAWEGGEELPDEEELARLIGHWDPAKAEVEIMDPTSWDRNGQYADIIDAVAQASKGNDVRVYRVARDGTRAEYFVITRAGSGKDARLVGVKALAVES
ncbi:hypothetical protein NKR23_g7637 [Pleurostoma richardsiae]|uniref:Uncharacterized protein n=1 Tax=Pleurostoma richardsiae TaxID=41990 RepID=A0AA38VDC7_9PEZI|nr:hypothetical protein NKR23_g7637 [Pleurostoma richardsiae]